MMAKLLLIQKLILIALTLRKLTTISAFISPKQTFSVTTNIKKNNNHLLNNHAALPSSISVITEPSLTISASNDDVAFEDAFTDNVDLFGDSTVQLLFIGFGVFVILAVIAKFFLNQMDSAIEKVLVEFESTMKDKYASRWVSIEAKLEGLEEPERSQKLFEIMEGLQQTEPNFMEQVNSNMSSGR